MLGLQLYAEQCTLISLSLLSRAHLHGCHNYHTKEYHSDTMHRASRRCSFMNPSDSNWLALLHKMCSCLSVRYDYCFFCYTERLLSLSLEDRRKDYRGNYLELDKILTWANHDNNTGKSQHFFFLTCGRWGENSRQLCEMVCSFFFSSFFGDSSAA